MPNFYSPNNLDPEDPKMCHCLPVKTVVSGIQCILLITQCILFFHFHNGLAVIPQTLLVIFTLVSFVGFILEHQKIMLVHFWGMVVGLAVPLVLLCFAVFSLISNLIGSDVKKEQSPLEDVLISFAVFLFIFCFYIYYLCLCHKLVETVSLKTSTLPEFDTTQGLFQFNKDAYDGCETDNLLYPRL